MGVYAVYPPNPGEPGGPCAEPCCHIMCGIARRTAEQICRVCKQTIGWGGNVWFFVADMSGWPDHAECHDRAIQEAEAAREALLAPPPEAVPDTAQ